MRLLRMANFSEPSANIADIRFDPDRELCRDQIKKLAKCDWIRDGLNLIITGSTGSGKSWLACALGVCAANNFLSVRYIRLPQLLEDLTLARETDKYAR